MRRKVISLLLAAAIAIAGIAVYLVRSAPEDRGAVGGLRAYYFNPSAGRLQSAGVTISHGTPLRQLEELLNRFYQPPRDLVGLWPRGMLLMGLDFYEGIAGVALPRDFRDMSAAEQALLRAGLTLTLTQLHFVERVLFWVECPEPDEPGEGEEPTEVITPPPFAQMLRNEEYWNIFIVYIESEATVANDPSISPGVMQVHTITLYFVCAEGEGLVTETFEDEYIDIHRLAEIKLNMLIAGPAGEDAIRIIPPETRLRSTTYDSATRSLYVDLSLDFESRFIGTRDQARLMLQSIVNTLTASANVVDTDRQVRYVLFLIDTHRFETFHGVENFDLAFTYDAFVTLTDDYEEENDNEEENDDLYAYSNDNGYEEIYIEETHLVEG